jgi:hypothetical protein
MRKINASGIESRDGTREFVAAARIALGATLANLACGLVLAVPAAAEPLQKPATNNSSPLAGSGQLQRSQGALSVQHVLLLSIDGAHALDIANYTRSNPHSALAELTGMAVTYTNASLPIGDFYPGVLSFVTGGTPNSTGVWYDEGYDRSLSPAGSDCSQVGTVFLYDEKIDFNVDLVDGGGGINPAKLPRDPKKGCRPVYPHDFVRVNTIFDLAKAAGKRTAWADKHWSCELVTGHSGKGVDDFYIREVGTGKASSDIARTTESDDFRVRAVITQIDGFNHDRSQRVGIPGIFGMTFQALAVEQKQSSGGYLDAAGTPSAAVLSTLKHVDQSIGKILSELKAQNLLSSTLIVVTAVHGDSPIDRKLSRKLDDDLIPKMIGEELLAEAVQDTEAFLWLKDQSQTARVVALLSRPENRSKAAINEIVWGEALKLQYNDPLQDGRTPDIIVKPLVGVFYAAATSTKISEHGGFYAQDVNVPLLLANPSLKAAVIKTAVPTTAVAPTILQALGLDPQGLEAVRMEKTPLLPGLF